MYILFSNKKVNLSHKYLENLHARKTKVTKSKCLFYSDINHETWFQNSLEYGSVSTNSNQKNQQPATRRSSNKSSLQRCQPTSNQTNQQPATRRSSNKSSLQRCQPTSNQINQQPVTRGRIPTSFRLLHHLRRSHLQSHQSRLRNHCRLRRSHRSRR